MAAPIRDVLDTTYRASDPDTVAGGRRVLDFPSRYQPTTVVHRVTVTVCARLEHDAVAVQSVVAHTEIAADGAVAENRGLNSTHVLGRFPTASDAARQVRHVLTAPWEHLLSL